MKKETQKKIGVRYLVIKVINFARYAKNRVMTYLRECILPISCRLVSFLPRQKTAGRKKLLIVRIDAIGDFMIFNPFIAYYRKFFKDYEITLLVNGVNRAMAERHLANKTIDRIMIFDRKKSNSKFFYVASLLKNIRRQGFDIAIYPTYSREIIGDYLIAASGAAEKIGFDGDYRNITVRDRNKTDMMYTALMPASKDVLPEPERNKEFTEGITKKFGFEISIDSYFPVFTPTAEEAAAAETLLSSAGYDSQKKYAIVCPGSSDPQKNWQIEKFAEVITDLHHTYGLETIICGSGQEQEMAEVLKKMLAFPIIDLTGKAPLPIFGAICTKVKIYIGNDTGTTHIAAAAGLPVVCVVGGGIDRFFPYGNPKTRIAVYDTIQYEKTASEPVLRYRMMHGTEKNVKVGQVLEAVREILEKTPDDTEI